MFRDHPHVIYVLGGIFALLGIATAIVLTMKALSKKDRTELWLRVRSWWIIIVIFSLAILGTRAVSLTFLGLVSFLALKEFLSMIPTRRADRRVLFWAYLAIPFQYYWINIDWYGMFIIFIPVYLFLFLPLRMVTIGETKGFVAAAGTIQWALMMTVFSVSHLAYLLVLPAYKNPIGGGAGLVLYVVLLTEFNDVAQYVWGKSTGRHKVIPKVSPNKTVEGLLGGVFTTTCASGLLGPYLTPMPLKESFIVGMMISFAGFIGDVVVSAIKRDVGVKDSGTLIPGHGGIMDRIDSLTYTAPLFFHMIRYFNY